MYVLQVLDMVAEVAPGVSASLVLFIYFNPITARGVPRLCQQAKAAGVSGETTATAFTAWHSRTNPASVQDSAKAPETSQSTNHEDIG